MNYCEQFHVDSNHCNVVSGELKWSDSSTLHTFDLRVGESRLLGTAERNIRSWSTLQMERHQEEVRFRPTLQGRWQQLEAWRLVQRLCPYHWKGELEKSIAEHCNLQTCLGHYVCCCRCGHPARLQKIRHMQTLCRRLYILKLICKLKQNKTNLFNGP